MGRSIIDGTAIARNTIAEITFIPDPTHRHLVEMRPIRQIGETCSRSCWARLKIASGRSGPLEPVDDSQLAD